jgi:hypothetical protein
LGCAEVKGSWAKSDVAGPAMVRSLFLFLFLIFLPFFLFIFSLFHLSSNFKLEFFGKFSSDLKYNLNILVLLVFIIFSLYIFFLFSNSFPPPIFLWGFVFQNRI